MSAETAAHRGKARDEGDTFDLRDRLADEASPLRVGIRGLIRLVKEADHILALLDQRGQDGIAEFHGRPSADPHDVFGERLCLHEDIELAFASGFLFFYLGHRKLFPPPPERLGTGAALDF